MACNRLQFWSLTVQFIVYFVGLLLKTNSVDSLEDEESVGHFLVFVVVSVFMGTIVLALLEFYAMTEYVCLNISELAHIPMLLFGSPLTWTTLVHR
jgi:hypothetical protein